MKVLILKGVPASGKSIYAKALVASDPTKWKRLNRDDLHDMIDGYQRTKGNENYVLRLRDFAIIDALENGYSVIVDETNIGKKQPDRIRKLIEEHPNPKIRKTEIDIRYFVVPLDELLRRDALRKGTAQVGERAVRTMYKRYMEEDDVPEATNVDPIQVETPPTVERYKYTEGLPWVILCDIDGTVAHMTEKGRLRYGRQAPYMWSKVGEDVVDKEVRDALARYAVSPKIVGEDFIPDVSVFMFSGRDSVCRGETEEWLEKNRVFYKELIMRPEGDMRADNIVKLELFDKHIRGKYNVLFVLDDRNQVVDMWRSLGLKCWQVAPGNF